jgi:RNA polymerase sigma-70 factor (ECF subfamily)
MASREDRLAAFAFEGSLVPDASASRARFETLLAEYAPALRRTARLYERDASAREDLFQDMCLALWQALPRFRGESSERTFVFRVAHNRGASHAWRRRRRDAAPLDEAPEPIDHAPSPEAAAAAGERRDDLIRAVLDLPLALQQTATLFLEGLTTREIGDVLGITENNVAVRLARARQALRARLTETSS